MNLSPLPIQKFFDSNGKPLVGGQLFTYVAGTSTKIATYQNEAGTPNTNPVILNYRGEADIWLDPELTYKFVLAPANDTDPPGSPIWTVDDIAGPLTILDLTRQLIGRILYPRTQAEIDAGVTPVYYYYEPGDVRRYGAVGDGVTDDHAAFEDAISIGETVRIPCGTYALSDELSPNVPLIGDGSRFTILRFTSPTRGLVALNFAPISWVGFTLEAADPGCLSAIYVATNVGSYVSDVQIGRHTVSDYWEYAVWGNNWQNSNVYGFRCYGAATTGIHLEYGCNMLAFYGPEITGLSSSYLRAVELTVVNSLGGGALTFDPQFYSLTLQGTWADGLMRVIGAQPVVHGFHFENTNLTPSDGFDVTISNSTVHATFSGGQGGSFGTTDDHQNRNIEIVDSEIASVVWGTLTSQSGCVGVRAQSFTDNGFNNFRYGCGSDSGGRFPDISGTGVAGLLGISGTPTAAVNLRGTATFAAATTVAVVFGSTEADANYTIQLTPKADPVGRLWSSSLGTGGFTINNSSSTSIAVDWLLVR